VEEAILTRQTPDLSAKRGGSSIGVPLELAVQIFTDGSWSAAVFLPYESGAPGISREFCPPILIRLGEP
jgi:hypothetical protein